MRPLSRTPAMKADGPRRRPFLAVLAAACLLGLAALAAAPASARVLISNIDQTPEFSEPLHGYVHAQGFTTGSSSTGFELTSVEVKFQTAPSSDIRVKIQQGSREGATIATLNNPPSLAAGNLTFRVAAETILAAGTTYFVVIDRATSGRIVATGSDNEEDGLSSWSIANDKHEFTNDGWRTFSNVALIRVNGEPLPVFSSATVDGTALRVTFSKALNIGSRPLGNQMWVRATLNGVTRGMNGGPANRMGVSGNTVTMTLASAVVPGETVLLNYQKPATDPLEDLDGNDVDSFMNKPVTNNTRSVTVPPPVPPAAGVLVGNLRQQPASTGSDLSAIDHAQGFTTGTNADGYALSSVTVNFATAPSGVSVRIATGLPSATTVVATLENPLSLAAGDLVFTAPANTVLSRSTTYHVVVEASSGTVSNTDSDSEDGGGRIAWSVANGSHTRTASSTGAWGSSDTALPIRVDGTLRDTTAPRHVSMSANGATLTVAYDEALDESVSLRPQQFALWINGALAENGAASASISGRTLKLTFGTAARHDDRVILAYGKTGSDSSRWIKDLSGNVAANFNVTFTRAGYANNTPPAFSSASVNGATLTVTFDGALDEGSVPAAGAFTVKATRSGTERTVALAATGAVDVEGATVTLALAEAVVAIDTVTVAYAKPEMDPLRDADNAKLPVTGFDGTARAANATPPDVTAPRHVSMSANGATLTVTYDEALDESVSLRPQQFALWINGALAENGAASASTSGRTLKLTFGTAARHDDRVNLAYAKTGSDSRRWIKDLSGNVAANFNVTFTRAGYANNTPPAFSSASVNGATLTVTFDGAAGRGFGAGGRAPSR